MSKNCSLVWNASPTPPGTGDENRLCTMRLMQGEQEEVKGDGKFLLE